MSEKDATRTGRFFFGLCLQVSTRGMSGMSHPKHAILESAEIGHLGELGEGCRPPAAIPARVRVYRTAFALHPPPTNKQDTSTIIVCTSLATRHDSLLEAFVCVHDRREAITRAIARRSLPPLLSAGLRTRTRRSRRSRRPPRPARQDEARTHTRTPAPTSPHSRQHERSAAPPGTTYSPARSFAGGVPKSPLWRCE